jgi:hypothetical protein
MPEIEGIVKTEVTIPIQMFGHTLLVTYRPFTEVEIDLEHCNTKQQQHDQVALFFRTLVSEWDATLNGEPLPINERTTAFGGPIPQEIMGAIIGAIAEDKEILTKKIRQAVYTRRIAEIDDEQREVAARLEMLDEEREKAE